MNKLTVERHNMYRLHCKAKLNARFICRMRQQNGRNPNALDASNLNIIESEAKFISVSVSQFMRFNFEILLRTIANSGGNRQVEL